MAPDPGQRSSHKRPSAFEPIKPPPRLTMGEARRKAGIPESDYLRKGDSVDRIATIRCLARIFGPPDHRYEHLNCCSLDWTVGREEPVTVVVKRNGAITS